MNGLRTNHIILSGCCGAMGRAIYRLTENSENEKVVAGIDKNSAANYPFEVYQSPLQCAYEADLVIDFSHPSLFNGVLDFCIQRRLPLMCGTTGLTAAQHEQMSFAAQKIPVFYSTNTSWGVFVLNKLVAEAARLLYGDFDIEIVEKHHRNKVDSPSGTAMTLLKNIQNQIPDLNPVFGRHGNEKRKDVEIGLSSVRGGSIVGEHEVIFAGQNEVIEITHTAQSREIFAQGALRAGRFLVAQKAGLYGMDALAQKQS